MRFVNYSVHLNVKQMNMNNFSFPFVDVFCDVSE